MSNPSKNKGSAAERLVAAWLRENGYPDACRSRAGWSADVGDILGVPGLVVEVKDAKTKRWGDWLCQLDAEKSNANVRDGVLIVKVAGTTDAGDWLAVRRVRDEFRCD